MRRLLPRIVLPVALLGFILSADGQIYQPTIDPIAQQAYVKASNTGTNDVFGAAVAVSGNTVVIGAPYENSNARGVNGNQSDNSAEHSGAAYVFVRNGTTWVQQAYLKASNTEASDLFGYSVAISGDTIIVGAYQESSSATGSNGNQADNNADYAGAAYIFVRSGTSWTQQAYLKASNTEGDDQFGHSVAISGDTVIVGAHYESSDAVGVDGDQNNNRADGSGAAYVFVRSGTTWTQQAYLKASNTDPGDLFGYSVALFGDTIVVGALGENSNATGINGNQADNSAGNAGAAYVFVREGTVWTQQAYLKASSIAPDDLFGFSVAVSDDIVVAGAPQDVSSIAGAAYVFMRSETTWTQQAYLKASNTRTGDSFGYSVAVSGETVVIGARKEDSNATGVNGNQNDSTALNSGAAYVFVHEETAWTQQAYLKSSNTELGDSFGACVAASCELVVVGASVEDSNAIGVNGDGSNNSAAQSGAAYIFGGLGLGPRLSIMRDGSNGYFLRFNGVPGCSYRVERATSLTAPWTTINTTNAPASSLVEYQDTTAPADQAFYRTAQP